MVNIEFEKQGEVYVSGVLTSTGNAIVIQMETAYKAEVQISARIGDLPFQVIHSFRNGTILPPVSIEVPEGVDVRITSTAEVINAGAIIS